MTTANTLQEAGTPGGGAPTTARSDTSQEAGTPNDGATEDLEWRHGSE